MYEITCFDSDGNSIDYFNQWDINQEITIKINGQDENYLRYEPFVHFSNSKSKTALKVQSTVIDNNVIVSQVPNVLLQEPLPLFISVYLADSDNENSRRTILSDEIIVRKQPKPDDYKYVENITQITAKQIKKEIKRELVDEISESYYCFSGITFLDEKRKTPYRIYVSDEKLMLKSVVESEVTQEMLSSAVSGVAFIDEFTGDKYRVFVYNGKLRMDKIY